MAFFCIEILSNGEWTDDASLLGHGCNQDDNRWPTEAEALAACDELSQAWGCPRSDLRVVRA